MCTINKLNNEANGDNNTAIVLYRGGDRKGKWWSESKEFADCFGADNGKETIMQEFTSRNVLDISFRSSIAHRLKRVICLLSLPGSSWIMTSPIRIHPLNK